MGNRKSKICRMAIAAMVVVFAVSMRQDAGDAWTRGGAVVDAPVRTAGFGGVLVSKRMRMILGFVQTLPV